MCFVVVVVFNSGEFFSFLNLFLLFQSLSEPFFEPRQR